MILLLKADSSLLGTDNVCGQISKDVFGIMCILCTPRPIYQSTDRPTVDRCIGRHIGRVSTDMSVDVSVECRSKCRPRCVVHISADI